MTQLPPLADAAASQPVPASQFYGSAPPTYGVHLFQHVPSFPASQPFLASQPSVSQPSAQPPRPCCPMPYHPDVGVDRKTHSEDAGKAFYVVKSGRVKGVFTNPEMARIQVSGYSNFSMRAVATWDEAVAEWEAFCRANHGVTCPNAAVNAGAAPPAASSSQAPPTTTVPANAPASAPSSTVPPSPAPSMVSLASQSSIGSSQLSDSLNLGAVATGGSETAASMSAAVAQGTWTLPLSMPPATQSRAPLTMDTRVHLANNVSEMMFWGVPGVMTVFRSRPEAVEAARNQGIERPNVWGHPEQRVISDWILSGDQEK
ncbi:hypothetical protein DFH06DRAFT_1322444 [Mycena polygramma]|nr:hypothetical protein DFH06DRAFT_1143227 [Mycena polygramma]KAJ7667880.1 hypothetical protein DFH06DRAFT_1322444 [Mycena polygramma]